MRSWTPQAVLANITLRTAIEAGPAAFVPPGDARIEAFSATHPIHAEFLERFTNAFGKRVRPTVLILESTAMADDDHAAAMASIRDILSISIVPRARARHILHKGGSRVFYSKSFDFYSWMVSRDNEQLVAGTPGLLALHDIRCFGGKPRPKSMRLTSRRGTWTNPSSMPLSSVGGTRMAGRTCPGRMPS